MEMYRLFMLTREELDVLIDGKYGLLGNMKGLKDEKEVVEKIKKMSEQLNKLEHSVICEIVMRMPEQLFNTMLIYGLKAEITADMR